MTSYVGDKEIDFGRQTYWQIHRDACAVRVALSGDAVDEYFDVSRTEEPFVNLIHAYHVGVSGELYIVCTTTQVFSMSDSLNREKHPSGLTRESVERVYAPNSWIRAEGFFRGAPVATIDPARNLRDAAE